jgi:L-ribulose-5-phosphate 3-epimerase
MAEAAAEIGFDGVDLTVRPKGHVEPERAADDLPKAVEAIHQAGLKAKMMASGINHVNNSVNQTVIDTAATQGIQYYRAQVLPFSR